MRCRFDMIRPANTKRHRPPSAIEKQLLNLSMSSTAMCDFMTSARTDKGILSRGTSVSRHNKKWPLRVVSGTFVVLDVALGSSLLGQTDCNDDCDEAASTYNDNYVDCTSSLNGASSTRRSLGSTGLEATLVSR